MLLNCGVEDAWETLGLQDIKPVNPKGNQFCMFISRADEKTPILWPHDGKTWLIGKDPDVGQDWRQEEKGITEEEMFGCESWTIKKVECLRNWCFQTVMLEKTLERPLNSKEIKPVNPKGNQSRIFIGRTEAEAPILWPPDAKSQLIGKDPDAGKNWEEQEKGTTEDKMGG